MASLALPLSREGAKDGQTVVYSIRGGEEMWVPLSTGILESVATLGLSHAVGCLQLLQVIHFPYLSHFLLFHHLLLSSRWVILEFLAILGRSHLWGAYNLCR